MTLAYEATGRGPKLVLLHPVGLSSAFWPGLDERLGDRFRLLAVDLGGHGASPDVARPGRFADRLAEVVAFLEEHRPAALLGVSFGGMLAMQVAIARPDLVQALVLAACPLAIPEAGRKNIRERGRAAEQGSMAAVLEPTLERWFTPAFMDDPDVARVRERLRANSPSNWAGTWEAVAEHDALDQLGAISALTLVIAGEKDAATPLEAKKTLAAAISGAKLVVMEDAPHMLQIERAAEFAEQVDAFLTSVALRSDEV
jgi:3-oxoadipate enol-lactonase